ncbi:putative quinol monooxygenase [Streptomyces globisporus]|uniref:putative quinol monooxygenase n=1 Tax=Streptomyces globisporus TaxID=1908 RepID=UPI0036B13BA8|nr:antibiotic biosynthesis monooxygenase [Streptomyces globisporus]
MGDGYALVVRFKLRDTSAAQRFDDLVAQTIGGIRGEAGTLVYAVHTPVDEPLTRLFYELYADKEAFQVHEEQPHTRHFLGAREELLSDVQVSFLNEHDDLGKRPSAEQP